MLNCHDQKQLKEEFVLADDSRGPHVLNSRERVTAVERQKITASLSARRKQGEQRREVGPGYKQSHALGLYLLHAERSTSSPDLAALSEGRKDPSEALGPPPGMPFSRKASPPKSSHIPPADSTS